MQQSECYYRLAGIFMSLIRHSSHALLKTVAMLSLWIQNTSEGMLFASQNGRVQNHFPSRSSFLQKAVHRTCQ